MNVKKPILYILLLTLGVILLYNYLIAPVLIQNSYQMGMGMRMHGRVYNSYNYFVDTRYIILIIILIAGFILYQVMKQYQTTEMKCSKCGKWIENERWKICPLCGTSIRKRRGEGT